MPTARQPEPTRWERLLAAAPVVSFRGSDYRFTLDVNDWCDIEERTGQNTKQLMDGLAADPKIGTIRMLFAAGLSTKEQVFSDAEAAEVINEVGLARAIEMIAEAAAALFAA